MLSVTIPWDRSTASVKMEFVEMEPNAQVTVYNISFYLIFPYFLVDIAPDLNLYKSVMSLISVRYSTGSRPSRTSPSA